MTLYSHPNLTRAQKIKARWRSLKHVVALGADMREREGLSARDAAKLAAGQHNANVARMREQNEAQP